MPHTLKSIQRVLGSTWEFESEGNACQATSHPDNLDVVPVDSERLTRCLGVVNWARETMLYLRYFIFKYRRYYYHGYSSFSDWFCGIYRECLNLGHLPPR